MSKKNKKFLRYKDERGKKNPLEKDFDDDVKSFTLDSETKKSVAAVILAVIAVLAILSFLGAAGSFGEGMKKVLGIILGWGEYIFPIVLILFSYLIFLPAKHLVSGVNYLGASLFFVASLGILQFFKDWQEITTAVAGIGGGYLGYIIFWPLQHFMGSYAGLIVLLALLLIAVLIMFNTSLSSVAGKLKVKDFFKNRVSRGEENVAWQDEEEEVVEEEWSGDDLLDPTVDEPKELQAGKDFQKKELGAKVAEQAPVVREQELRINPRRRKVEVPLSLLESRTGHPTSVDIKVNGEVIRNTLEKFGIPVDMDEVNIGPTFTQFTFRPHEGIKLNRITTLQDNLALALAAHPIRIEAPIPGRALVGVEVPNQKIATVKLKDIIVSPEFKNKKGILRVALGEDVSGRSWVIDLAAMPHLLIAGATGSGKSVCINSVIISLLFQYSPEDLRFLIVDPKKVELTNYNGIPHLLTPVITEVDKTINALRWAVKEMEERFKILSGAGKRNIVAYNSAVLVNKLPYIVIIIDELADLMATSARDVEAAIVRLSQMARAVGIHLVVATQRPSVNVITGLIKANIPGRIAFAVASQIDSRTILDTSGAEKLLGKGDLLFKAADLGKPRRIQGAFLADAEIERVIDFWKQQDEPDYNDAVTESHSGSGASPVDFSADGDELLEEAKDILIKAGKASASLLQRRLRVGYARAARLLDLLEEQGIIGPGDGAKPREILVSDSNLFHIPTETTAKYENQNYQEPVVDEEDEEVIIGNDVVDEVVAVETEEVAEDNNEEEETEDEEEEDKDLKNS